MADTRFDIEIDVEASTVAPSAEALARLGERLVAAGTAAAAASAALKTAESAYAAAERAANNTAKTVEKLNEALAQQKARMGEALLANDPAAYARAAAAVQQLELRQREASAAADKAKASLLAEAAALDKAAAAAKQAEAAEEQLKKAHDAQKGANEKATKGLQKLQDQASGSGKVNEMAEAFGALGGPVGSLGQKALSSATGFNKLVGALGSAGAAYAAVAVIVIGLTAALVGGTIALFKWSVTMSDAARTSELLSAGIAKSVAGGAELEDSINQLSKRVPQSRDELRSMAADLAKTGLKGKALTDALEGAAEQAAELKWGPDWAKQTKSLDKQSQVFKGHLSDIFKLNIEPLLEGLSKLVALFDAQSETGMAIKTVFQDVFQKLTDWLTELTPKIVAAFIQFEIWALKALIAIKPYGSTFVSIGKIVGTAILVIVGVFAALLAVILGVAAAAGFVVASFINLVIEVGKAIAQCELFKIAWAAIVGVFDSVKNAASGVIDWLKGLTLENIGTQLVEGLANGITKGAAAVLAAITGVVGGAVNAATSLLRINSPSKVFADIGESTGEGMAKGVESSTGEVRGSLESMVSPELEGTGPTAPTAGAGARGGAFDFSGATFIFYGVANAEDAVNGFEDVMTKILEGDVAQLGGGEPAPA